MLANPAGAPLAPIQLSDALPSELVYAGGLSASSGSAAVGGQTITWSGSVYAGTPVTISFRAQISAAITSPTLITNDAQITGGQTMALRARIVVNGLAEWLPLVRR